MSRTAPYLDLRPDHWAIVCGVLRRNVPDRKVLAFGSRATWTAKDYSDLDLAILGDEPLSPDATSALAEGFRGSNLPFKVDLVDWARIDETFRDIIRCDGVAVQVPAGGAAATGSMRRSLSTFEKSGNEARQLGIYAEIVMGQSPPGDTTNTSGEGVPLLNGPTEFGAHHPEPAQFTTDARKMACPGDLLFCVRGSTTGRMNWADQEYAIGRGIAAIRHKRGQQLQPFVRAVVAFGLPDLLTQATGSTFPNVSAQQLAKLWWPPLEVPEQGAIAHILGTLDDKIELNRRMNETLEAMARALFKSWFVDFDPVRAKMEGRDIGLPKDIADLFPDRLVESDLGLIPEGWEVRPLGDLVETVKGRSYKSKELIESETALVTLKSFARGGGYRLEGLKSFSGTYKSDQVVDPGEIVIACTDVTQAAEVIGRPAIVQAAATYRTLVASLDTLIVRPSHQGMTRAFLYFLTGNDEFVAHTYAHTTGTTVLHLAKEAVPSFRFPQPPTLLIHSFDAVVRPALERIQTSQQESAPLATIRNTLLPKLISSEVRVKDAVTLFHRMP